MSEAVGVAPARRRSAEVEGLRFAVAFGGVALAVLAVWLPFWDPASLAGLRPESLLSATIC